MSFNDVKINHGFLQSDWTSAAAYFHLYCFAVGRKKNLRVNVLLLRFLALI